MDIRFAGEADGVDAALAGRRTSYGVDGRVITTRFRGPTTVEVDGEAPTSETFAALAAEIFWWSEQVAEVSWGSESRANP